MPRRGDHPFPNTLTKNIPPASATRLPEVITICPIAAPVDTSTAIPAATMQQPRVSRAIASVLSCFFVVTPSSLIS